MFKDNVFKVKETIDPLVNIPEDQLKKKVIDDILSKKLDRSYDNYIENLTSKINYILSRNNYRVIKAINKMKQEELEEQEELEYKNLEDIYE